MNGPQLVYIDMVEGDTLPVLPFRYSSVDVTGFGFEFRAKRKDGSVLRRPGIITDAVNGEATFVWLAGDVALVDPKAQQEIQPAQITITNTTGGVLTYDRLALRVRRRVA